MNRWTSDKLLLEATKVASSAGEARESARRLVSKRTRRAALPTRSVNPSQLEIVETANERERKRLAVIPLNLDKYLLSGEWRSGKAKTVLGRLWLL